MRGPFFLGVLVFAVPRVAVGAPVELDWKTPPDCPSAADVQAEIARNAGDVGAAVHARAEVVHEENGPWKVTLVTERDGVIGRRTFEAETCAAAADATALIVALTVHPDPVAPPPPPESPSPPRESPAHFAVRGSVVADTATLPSVSAGPAIAVAWLPGPWRLEVQGAYGVSQRAEANAAGADFAIVRGGLHVGRSIPLGSFTIGALVGGDLLSLTAKGFGGTASFDQSAVYADVSGGVSLAWTMFSRVSLRASATAVFPVGRPSFVVIDPAPAPEALVHRPSAVSGRGEFGIEWQFF